MKLCLVFLIFSTSLFGLTKVAQSILNPDGTLASGTALIRITAPCRSGTSYVGDKTISVKFVAGGFSVPLVPNDTCIPSGTSYTVAWLLAGGTTRTQTWVVPTSGSAVTVDSVIVQVAPSPQVTIPAAQITGLPAQSLLNYGAKCDATVSGTTVSGTNDTAAMNAAILDAYNKHGGSIFVPNAKCWIAGQVVLPNDNTPVNVLFPFGRQPNIRITGVGDERTGMGSLPNATYGGSTLLMTYSGTDTKLVTLGLGGLELDHLTFWDPSGSSTPFILTTGTTLNIHDNSFVGSKSGQLADLDAIILGGTCPSCNSGSTGVALNNTDAPFQGYDTHINNNYFNLIRRAVYARTWVASTHIDGNFVAWQSGSNLVNGAPFEFDGHWVGNNTIENQLVNNRCEITNYYYCAKFLTSTGNYVAGNDVEDANTPAINTAVYFFDAASIGNFVAINTASTLATHVVDLSGQNMVIDSIPNSASSLANGVSSSLTVNALTTQSTVIHSQPLGAATVSNNRAASPITIRGTYWDGTTTQNDNWAWTHQLGTGANPTSTLALSHAGSSGTATLTVPMAIRFGSASSGFDAAGNLNVSSGLISSLGGPVAVSNNDISIQTTTAATSGANASSPNTLYKANYWNGAASALDFWQLHNVLGGGTNPTSTLIVGHVGSPGVASISLPPFSGTVDSHSATKTLPHRSGTGTPVARDACATVGETYFQTDATAGSNIFGCTTVGAPGTWTLEGGSSGGTTISGLTATALVTGLAGGANVQTPSATSTMDASGNISTPGTITATTKIVTGIYAPSSDSTTSVKVTKADGSTAIVTVDSTNSKVGIGLAPTGVLGAYAQAIALETFGVVRATSTLAQAQFMEISGRGATSDMYLHASGISKSLYIANESTSGAPTGIKFMQGISGAVNEVGRFDGTGNFVSDVSVQAPLYSTQTNCSSSAAPAVCASAAAGSVVVAAAATTVVVNTTAVTASSQVMLTFDSSLGTKLGVTCNTTQPALFGVTARSTGVSFTITASAPTTNPACFSYAIWN